jgi:hypothetical protein
VVLFLLVLLVPSDGQVPLVAHAKAVGSVPGRMKVVAILQLLWDVVPLFGLLCWLPAPGAAGTKVLAWVLITQPVVQSLIANLVTPHPEGLGTALQSGMFAWILGPLAAMAWLCLLGYGIATVLGKQLEHR